jgi:hypothetical protein
MSCSALASTLALVVAGTGAAPSRPGPLGVIPADALAAVAIRNLAELKSRGDKLIADTDVKSLPRPSQLFDLVYNFLGVRGAVDLEGSAAIVLAAPDKNKKESDQHPEQFLVGILPFNDRDKLAACFGFKAGELKPGKAMPTKTQVPLIQFAYVRGKHLFLGMDDTVVARVAQAKTLHDVLPAAGRKTAAEADLLIHLTPWAWHKLGELQGTPHALEGLLTRGLEPAEATVVRDLLHAIDEMRFALATVRIDRGLRFNLQAIFPAKGAKSADKLLGDLGSGSGSAGLAGLPEGPVFAAQAFRGDGAKGAIIVRALFESLLGHFAQTHQILSAANRPVYADFLAEVWRHLEGSRSALYQTSDEPALGLFSLVAVLDTEDGARFVADMRALAQLADESEADQPARAAVDLAKLVRELGDPKYRVRELATLKLRLLGEPALAALKKGMASNDVETARRATRLWDQINRAGAERRKELLSQKLPRHLRPTLTFLRKRETLAGQPIDVVHIKLADRDVPAAKQLRGLLGPEWDRMRLAVHGKQVVALLGSEVELLTRTLDNLKAGRPGLAGAKALAGFKGPAAAGRKIELHVSAQRLLALVTPPADGPRLPADPGKALTSFALSVGPHNLQFDVCLPLEEMRLVARKSGW